MYSVLVIDGGALHARLKARLDSAGVLVHASPSMEGALAGVAALKPDVVVLGEYRGLPPAELFKTARAAPELKATRFLVVADVKSPAAQAFLRAGGGECAPLDAGDEKLAERVLSLLGTGPGGGPQVSLRVLASLRLDGSDAGAWVFANLLEMSLRSVVLELAEPMPLGARLQLRCFLPGLADRMLLTARIDGVVDEATQQVRAALVDLEAADRGLLEEWIAARAKKARGARG